MIHQMEILLNEHMLVMSSEPNRKIIFDLHSYNLLTIHYYHMLI